MISKVKGVVKSALMQRKIEEYYAGLDAQFVSYDAWIKEREQKEEKADAIGAVDAVEAAFSLGVVSTSSVQIIEFISCGEDFSLSAICGNSKAESDLSDSMANRILVFVRDKNRLASDAINVIVDYFTANPDCVLVYGDEDEWNFNGTIRMNPWFKPDFSPDILLQYFYYGNVVAVRIEAVRDIVWKQSKDYLINLYDMCLQLSFPVERQKIGHVQYVLYHADNLKRLCTGDEYRDLRLQYASGFGMNPDMDLDQNTDKNFNSNNKISIVIPSKDHPEVLEVCLESLINTGKNENIEIIVVDNGSNENARQKYENLKVKYGFNYIFKPMDFNFSYMCNLGAKASSGEYLLFLNDDIEAIEEGWLAKMRAHASKSYVGAVGAKLYYPDSKKIQHAGITNLRLGPVHKMQFLEDVRPYYDGRNQYDVNVIAVTGACLMIRKDVFIKCGGFSQDLAVAFNDVELCFRLYKMGYYNVQCNDAVLYHHESLSRGNDESADKQVRLQNERKKMYVKHPDLYGKDPFYHPYLNNEILDTNFSYAYEYPAGEEIDIFKPKLLEGGLKSDWYNECLLISFEYASDLAAWTQLPDKEGKELYFQGYHFVVGSDNSCFKRFVLLKNVDNGDVWEIPCGEVFRPDLEMNLTEGHASLCGFAFVIEKSSLPAGKYQVGCMAVSLINRQRLCRFVNKFITV